MEAKHRGFIYRIMVILLSVSLIPFLIGSAYSMNVLVKQAVDLVNAKNDNELKRTVALLDAALRQIRDIVMSSIVEERFLQAQSITERLLLLDRLNKIAASNKYIDEVVWYSADDPFVLVSNHGIERSLELPAYSWIGPAVQGMFNYQIKATQVRELKLVAGQRLVFSWMAKLPQQDGRQYYVIFHINIERLYNDYIRELNKDQDMGQLYLVDTSTDAIVFPHLIRAEEDMVRTEYKLEVAGWKLVSELNLNNLYRDVASTKNQFIVLLSIVGIVIILASGGMGFRFLYRPVRNVLRKNDRLEVQLLEKEELLKRTLLHNLIKDRFESHADLERLSEYGGFLIIVIYTIKIAETEYGEDEQGSLMQRVNARLDHLNLAETYQESDKQWFALFKLEQPDLNTFIVEMLASLNDTLLGKLDISIGGIHRLDKINHSYTEALYAYNMGRIYTTDTNIFCYNKLPIDYHQQIGLHTIEELELAIRQHNEKTYVDLLNDMFREDVSVMEYNYNMYMHITVLIRLYDQNSVTFLNEMNELIVERGTMNTVVLKQFFYSKYKSFFSEYQKDFKQYLRKIEQFISESYHTNFSLDDLADHVGLSKQYVSAIFKQHHGMTVIDYVNRHRIEQGKLLLTDPGIKIVDVSSRVGFNSNSYFNKVFKQYTGLTPSEYRELALNRQEA
ncbi:helix-turn-helix transcriptional regulator [Paenibacillus koleovorans]|uniref:helix-turn-helix transcriptional regulator n=1 Tax=Paenibacillus koleovorans TaxID=121608 RepID=UPI000FD81E29|nr:AraC family transcriptional regulator [Paenibacillus koleovorans]